MRRDDSVTTDSPLVSVVIPSYNASRTIVRAIDSALRQSYSRLEIIVSDDGSTDATSELVSKFSDPRVSFHVATANGGAAAARNRGIRASSGSYVAFLDADDVWLPEKLSRQMRLLEQNPNARIGTCDCLFLDVNGHPRSSFYQRREPVGGEAGWQALLAYNFIQTSTVVVRKEDLDRAGGFSETLPTGEDQDLWIRLAARGEVVFDPEVLVRVHDEPGSLAKRYQEREGMLLLSIVRAHLREQQDRLAGDQIRLIWGRRLFDIAAILYHNKYYGRSAPLFWQAARSRVRPGKSIFNVLRATAHGVLGRDQGFNLKEWRDGLAQAAVPVNK